MCKLYNNNRNNIITSGGRFVAVLLLLFFSALPSFSQETDNIMEAPDSAFTMQVSRGKAEVLITLSFAPDCIFQSAAIERKSEADKAYSQCQNIEYDEVAKKGLHIVKTDNYPFPAQTNVLYRLKLMGKEGFERSYPPILLAGINH